MCSTSFNEWFFTPEGDRIPRDTKPTYWHHPALGAGNKPGSAIRWLKRRLKRAAREAPEARDAGEERQDR